MYLSFFLNFMAIPTAYRSFRPGLNPSFYSQFFFFFFLVFCPFQGHTRSMRRFSGQGVKSELYPLAYNTATATRDLSLVCHLHHSSWQCCQILNPLSKARDRTHSLMVPSQDSFLLCHDRNSCSQILNQLYISLFKNTLLLLSSLFSVFPPIQPAHAFSVHILSLINTLFASKKTFLLKNAHHHLSFQQVITEPSRVTDHHNKNINCYRVAINLQFVLNRTTVYVKYKHDM